MAKKIDYLKKIKSLLSDLPAELHVEFSIHCAKDSRQFANKKDYIVIDTAINLTERWLKHRDVTQAQLIQVAYSAANSADSAAYSAKLKEYYNYLESLVNNLSKIEKIIYGLNT